MGILHRMILAFIPLADSQSPLYNAKLAIIRHIYNAIISISKVKSIKKTKCNCPRLTRFINRGIYWSLLQFNCY